MKQFKAAPGVFDILPEDTKDPWKSMPVWSYLESVIRETAKQYGYQEIRIPIFERTELFTRSVGEVTDIVSKEMYTFEDRGGRSMSLRPEGTASVIRAYVEHSLAHQSSVQKLFYIGPMFRYERTQAGRYRQHHQFGAEAIGVRSPEQDAEMIDLIYTLYRRLGLENLEIHISTLGDSDSRQTFREALRSYLHDHADKLSEDSKIRLDKNPLRILDSKDPRDQEVLKKAPSILDYLSSDAQDHFQEVLKLLDTLSIPYQVNKQIVRGLDYYNRTVFEVVATELGAQNSIGGGGRYDHLVKDLGGSDTPAIGFATGLERVIQAMLKQQVYLPPAERPALYLIPLGKEAKKTCFILTHSLRRQGIPAEMEMTGKKLGKAMQMADQSGAEYTAVIGDQELETMQATLKEMSSGKTFEAPLGSLGKILKVSRDQEEILAQWDRMSQPFQDPKEIQFFLSKLGESIDSTQTLIDRLQKALKEMNEMI